MVFENIIKIALDESINGVRKGDKAEEIEAIQNYLKNSKKIIIPTKNNTKVKVINNALRNFGISKAKHLEINTNLVDASRTPAISKGIMALDQCDCEVVISRGRLGIPGSGSMLVFLDNKGRILTAGFSSSHIIHKKSLEESVHNETKMALERIGLKELNY